MFFILRFHTASKIKGWFIRSSKLRKSILIYFIILNYAYVRIEKLKQELLYLT